MSNIMNPILPGMPAAAPQEMKSQVEPGGENSFTDYMDKKMQAARTEKKNLLGVKEREAKAPKQAAADEKAQANSSSVAAVLQQLMADLKKLVKQPDSDNGEWRFELKNLGLLDKLAEPAGMSLADLSLLKKQMEEQGSLALADLFAVLQKNFQAQGEELSVTVAETGLPLLETFLSRMGLSPEKLTQLSDQAVNGLGELDLQAYLEGLQALSGEEKLDATVLSDWELEQLQMLLQEAGISKSQMAELFPEKNAMWEQALAGQPFDASEGQVALDLARLQEMLEQAVAAKDASRSQADLPAFLRELHTILSQTGKESKEVGWSPVVQESMTAVYQELQKMMDLAKVKVEKASEMTAIDEDLARQWLSSGEKEPLDSTVVKEVAALTLAATGDGDGEEVDLQQEILGSALEKTDDKSLENSLAKVSPESLNDEGSVEQQLKTGTDKVHTPRIRLTPEVQQFAADQISHGVLRGLRNNDHHLTLTLYPKELGEVKVDMQVRDSQLTLTFVMENSKVKQALESNMQDFKDNLEQKGFTLQECSVSVGQNDSDEGRRLFEMAWEKMVENQLAEINSEPMGQVSHLADSRSEILRQGAISIFV